MKSMEVFRSLWCGSDVKQKVRWNKSKGSLIYQTRNLSLYGNLSVQIDFTEVLVPEDEWSTMFFPTSKT